VSTLKIFPEAVRRTADGGDAVSDDHALLEAFEALGPAYMRWVRSTTRPGQGGLTVARMRTLAMLRGFGPKPMGFIARESGIAPRTLTALIDGLEREGLARRVPHPTDRRATLIEITEAGQRTLRACFKPHRAAVSALFRSFSAGERAALASLIPRLVETIEANTPRKG
jgi:DNA-binding MarR family transcriptional regulator